MPKFYSHHEKWGFLNLEENNIFANFNHVNIEYCSGNGQWILEKAIKNPNINYIAVEMKFERARRIWVKMHNMDVKNLFVVFGESLIFTKNYLKEDVISNVFINFPDPWPKRRHAKNRLVSTPFMNELTRVVKKEGCTTFVTDDDNTARYMIEEALSHKNWKAVFQEPYYITEMPGYGGSYFDNLWRKKGEKIKYIRFLRG